MLAEKIDLIQFVGRLKSYHIGLNQAERIAQKFTVEQLRAILVKALFDQVNLEIKAKKVA